MVPRILIVPSASGAAAAMDAVVIAGAVELLRRRSRCELFVAASRDPNLPEAHFVDHTQVVEALTGCSLAAIVGRLAGPGLAHAAEVAFMARLLDVPVALIGVAVPAHVSVEDTALIQALTATAAAATAADAESAAFLGSGRGKRVEVVAPLELLARRPQATTASDRAVIGCDAALLQQIHRRSSQILATALHGTETTLRVFGDALLLPEGVACERAPDESVAALQAAIAGCTLLIAPSDSILHILATSAGVPSIAWADTAQAKISWHQRLGCSDHLVTPDLDAEQLRLRLTRARRESSTHVVERAVPLRAVAWRALGPLADVRSSAWMPTATLLPGVASTVARACERVVAPALAAGDARRAEATLARWEPVLAQQPAWSSARARAFALQGRDAEAIAVLERALELHATDSTCRIELARARTRQGDFAGARSLWSSVAADHPGDAAPLAEIAHLALLQGDTNAALAAWAAALRRDPLHAGSMRAVRALLDTEPRREVEFWAALCATHANEAGFWQAHGLAAARAIEWEIAERSLRRALELDPHAHAAHEALAAALERRSPRAASESSTSTAPVAGAATGRL